MTPPDEESRRLVFDDRTEMQVLGRAECYELLRGEVVGRVAFWDGREVTVLPVNYVFDNDRVAFRTAGGVKLSAAMDGVEVAFEVDGIHADERTGWSVVVHGVMTPSEPRDVERLESLGLRPWARAPKEHWVTISPARTSGRRILTIGEQNKVGPYARVHLPEGSPRAPDAT